ncbi:MAG: phosphatidate cytidylyltransferase [Leptospiraceae bacterium]|nr:phosphatidate cytidylyltransferase [Leptospiraceae bacterium]
MKETMMRILSAVILLPIFIFSFQYSAFLYYIPLLLLGLIVIYLGLTEFYKLSDRGEEGRPFRTTGILLGFLIFFIYYFNLLFRQNQLELPFWLENTARFFKADYEMVVMAVFLVTFFSYVWQIIYRPLDGAIFSVSTTVLGVLYLAIPLGHFLKLLSLPFGLYYIYIVCGLTMITDAGAYFGGRLFGRHPAGLKISPKKTIEGYVTGSITAVIYCLIINAIWIHALDKTPAFGTIETIIFGFVFSVISVAGDLSESAMKRDARTKDSAGTIPGHGGILDLSDALLFTIPCAYIYLVIKEMAGFSI